MQNVERALDVIAAAAEEYRPVRGGGGVRLEGLELFVGVRELQSMDAGMMALFISEVSASEREGEPGIVVTCVGMGTDMGSAVSEAVGHWCLGVLPALARWRGRHSCISSTREIVMRRGAFELIAGPVIGRGWDGDPAGYAEGFSQLLQQGLCDRPLAARPHWMELFASRSGDGSIEATCRLNNRDWRLGQTALERAAAAWPESAEPLRTCRQFALYVPKEGERRRIVLPSFWDRLRGRA